MSASMPRRLRTAAVLRKPWSSPQPAPRWEEGVMELRGMTDTSGTLFIVAAPSGAGKSTLVNALLEREPGISLSVSTPRGRLGPANNTVAITTSSNAPSSSAKSPKAFFSNMPKCTGISTVHRVRPCRIFAAGTRCVAGDRLAGCRANSQGQARLRERLHPAAITDGAGTSVCAAADRTVPK